MNTGGKSRYSEAKQTLPKGELLSGRRISAFKKLKTNNCIEKLAGVAGLVGHNIVNIVKHQRTFAIYITA